MPIPVQKALVLACPVVGAFLGIFLGVYLVRGVPVEGEFGWPVVAACATLGLLGLLGPAFLLRWVPARCPKCGGSAYLRTGSTFLRKQLARYSYRCAARGRDEAAATRRPRRGGRLLPHVSRPGRRGRKRASRDGRRVTNLTDAVESPPVNQERRMEAETKPARTCPACGSDRYQFRFRKRLPPEDSQSGEQVETKYRCKACDHEWRVRAPTG